MPMFKVHLVPIDYDDYDYDDRAGYSADVETFGPTMNYDVFVTDPDGDQVFGADGEGMQFRLYDEALQFAQHLAIKYNALITSEGL